MNIMHRLMLLTLCTLICTGCNGSTKIEIPTPNKEIEEEIGRDLVFTPEQLRLPSKKGVCLTMRENDRIEHMRRIGILRPGWNYSWGPDYPDNQLDGIEFIPMQWGKKFDEVKFEQIKRHVAEGKCKRLFAFNEPDGEKQADMTVEEALALWPRLESVCVPLGSPAVVGNDKKQWLERFMKEVEARKYRVDYICVHNYGGGDPAAFKAFIENIHNKYHRPIIITEFAVAHFGIDRPEANHHSPEKVYNFMKEVLPWLEATEYVYGYAWFQFEQDDAQGCTSALFDKEGNLTRLGEFYASFPNGGEVDALGPNLVKNPDFEEPPVSGWIPSKTNISYDNKISTPNLAANIISGNGTLRLAGKSAWADIRQTITVENGKTYRYGFTGRILDAAGPSGNKNSGHILNLMIREVGNKDRVFGTLNIQSGSDISQEGEVTVTQGMPLTLEIMISKANGIGYADDVFFKEIK